MSIINPANPLKKNGGAGVVNWENINGRPDLSDVSSMKTAPIVLTSILWNDSNRQTVPVEGVLADEEQQLVIVKPKRTSRALYNSCGIELIDQDDGFLIFECETVPDEDVSVNAFIIGAAEVGEEYTGEFVWWSPHMTSNTTPAPYVVNASTEHAESGKPNAGWNAFDGQFSTFWYGYYPNSSGTIAFDFGQKTFVGGIRMSMRENNSLGFPTNGSIEGSNDGITWILIRDFQNENPPNNHEFIEHMFDNIRLYRYYRLSNLISDFNGAAIISEIEFYKMEDPQ